MPRVQERAELGGVTLRVLDREAVHVPAGHGADLDHLRAARLRIVLRLLEDLDDASTTGQLLLGGLVQLRAELRERLERPELGQVQPETTRDLLHGLDLRRAADAAHRAPTLIAGRTPEKNSSVSRNSWPSVIEMTFVGM